MSINPEDAAKRARQLLDDPVVQDVFARLEARYVQNWKNTPPEAPQKREVFYAAVKALEDVKQTLNSLVNAPKVTQFNNRNLPPKGK